MIIIQEKSNHNFNNVTRERMYEQLYKQYKNGFMIIPEYLDVVYADEWDEEPTFKIYKPEENE